jgi:hypothetical protein
VWGLGVRIGQTPGSGQDSITLTQYALHVRMRVRPMEPLELGSFRDPGSLRLADVRLCFGLRALLGRTDCIPLFLTGSNGLDPLHLLIAEPVVTCTALELAPGLPRSPMLKVGRMVKVGIDVRPVAHREAVWQRALGAELVHVH